MSRWYRAYEGTVTDAKLGEVALVAGCSRSAAIAAWHCILESCAATNEKGRFEMTPRRCAVILQEPIPTIEAVFLEFASLGLVEDNTVSAWSKRQYESDNSTERVKKHRATSRNGGETFQKQDVTPPETETETETDTECVKEAHTREEEPSQEKVVQSLLDNHAADLSDWEQKFLIDVKWKASLTKTQVETLAGIKSKMAGKSGPPPVLLSVKRGTPAYEAWIAHHRRKGPATFYEKLDALTVPSEFPPQEQAA